MKAFCFNLLRFFVYETQLLDSITFLLLILLHCKLIVCLYLTITILTIWTGTREGLPNSRWRLTQPLFVQESMLIQITHRQTLPTLKVEWGNSTSLSVFILTAISQLLWENQLGWVFCCSSLCLRFNGKFEKTWMNKKQIITNKN